MNGMQETARCSMNKNHSLSLVALKLLLHAVPSVSCPPRKSGLSVIYQQAYIYTYTYSLSFVDGSLHMNLHAFCGSISFSIE